jgi:Na+/H+ antiporter NhaD/arsenite permease-like protein
MKKIWSFVRRETVLTAAVLLAAVSMAFVPPDAQYVSYINYRVLAILAGFMVAMSGLERLGVFTEIARSLLAVARGARSTAAVLILLCFFLSMAITNDVALITFVPLTLETLQLMRRPDLAVRIVALQTAAANLGSMATPIGNPQNIYLFDRMGVSFPAFLRIMLLPAGVSLALLLLAVWLLIRENAPAPERGSPARCGTVRKIPAWKLSVFLAAFALNVATVLDLVPYWLALPIPAAAALAADRRALKIDLSLLVTFAAFFIFIGNVQRIGAVAEFLRETVGGRELISGILLSQVISNVPATILLSGFTERLRALLYGVSLGGLGTLISSMANLISYKYIVNAEGQSARRYLLFFSLLSVALLVPLCLVVRLFCMR